MRKLKIFNGDDVSVISIESEMARLSLESNVVSNVVTTFKQIVPALNSKVKNYLLAFQNISDIFHTNGSRQLECLNIFKSESEKIQHINFVTYSKTVVSTPEGFNGTFLEYLITLNRVLPELFTSSVELLKEYNLVLSSFITNKESKISLKDHTALYKEGTKLRESVIKEIDVFFKKNDSSKKYLSNVLRRFSDLDRLLEEMKKLERLYQNNGLDVIKSEVKRSTDLLDIIIKNAEDGDSTVVSGPAAKNIAEGAYEIGKLVETISIMHFKIDQTLTSVRKLFDTIQKIS